MCSILGFFDFPGDSANLRAEALELSKRLRHRGPDWSGIYSDDSAILVHERLAIVDLEHGAQPLVSPEGRFVLAVNGEIYNHRELRAELEADYEFQTGSDCEVILALHQQAVLGQKDTSSWLDRLNGIFAFVLWDRHTKSYLIGRDPIGVLPLYTGRRKDGTFLVASEMKALVDRCQSLEPFPPGSFLDSQEGTVVRYYQPSWRTYSTVQGQTADLERLRAAFEAAVERQLMGDVPYGVLLSGGLDSSLVAAVAKRFSARRIETGGRDEAWWPRLHSFAIGLEGSPDLAASRIAAEALDTVHHELRFTLQEGFDALSDCIYHLETFDVTTIRASTPMFLMARRIKAMGIKMVLSGEGADEIFGGYLYFHKAPNAEEFHAETVRKLDQLHLYDCLRANKSMAAWGVEARVPFLDREFLDVAMGFDAAEKMAGPQRMEKFILRQAFDGYLPDAILWRQKEQFSDGVGYGWIDGLKERANIMVSDEVFERARFRFPTVPPATKEAYWYRSLFDAHFPGEPAAKTVPGGPSIACSTAAALAWDESFRSQADPSGRAIRGVHRDSWEPPGGGVLS